MKETDFSTLATKLRFWSTVALNPAQRKIYNQLQVNERHGQHSRPLDFSITENEVRKAANKLKIVNNHFRIKLQMK